MICAQVLDRIRKQMTRQIWRYMVKVRVRIVRYCQIHVYCLIRQNLHNPIFFTQKTAPNWFLGFVQILICRYFFISYYHIIFPYPFDVTYHYLRTFIIRYQNKEGGPYQCQRNNQVLYFLFIGNFYDAFGK